MTRRGCGHDREDANVPRARWAPPASQRGLGACARVPGRGKRRAAGGRCRLRLRPRAAAKRQWARGYRSASGRSRKAPLGEPGAVVVVVGSSVVVVTASVVVVSAGAVVVVGMGTPGGQGFGEQLPGPTSCPPWALHCAGVRSMQVSKAPPADDSTQHCVCVGVVVGAVAAAPVVVVVALGAVEVVAAAPGGLAAAAAHVVGV